MFWQVSPSFRTAINVPENIWPQFREKLHAVGVSLVKSDGKQEQLEAIQTDWSADLHTDVVLDVDKPASPTSGAVGT